MQARLHLDMLFSMSERTLIISSSASPLLVEFAKLGFLASLTQERSRPPLTAAAARRKSDLAFHSVDLSFV
jgi:hypothetical protein